MPRAVLRDYRKAIRDADRALKNGNPSLGSGERFAALQAKLARRPGVRNPRALAAYIGRKKYGKRKFQALSKSARRGRRRLR